MLEKNASKIHPMAKGQQTDVTHSHAHTVTHTHTYIYIYIYWDIVITNTNARRNGEIIMSRRPLVVFALDFRLWGQNKPKAKAKAKKALK